MLNLIAIYRVYNIMLYCIMLKQGQIVIQMHNSISGKLNSSPPSAAYMPQ